MYIAIGNSIGASSRVNGGGGGGSSFANKYSLNFDGVDDKVQFPSIALGTDYTLSAWAKRNSTANMFLFGNASTYGYGAYFNGVANLYFKDYALVTFNNIAVQTALARTDWVNWVFKKDSVAGTMAVYVDGVLAQSVTTTNGMSTFTTIGASGLSTGTQSVWNGNIDEVSIFNTSAIDLADLGSTTTPKDLSAISGLTNWYRNGDNGTWASPQFLVPSNINKDKVSNYSFAFDGVNDYINTGSSTLSGETALSISAWVYPTAYGGGAAESIISTEQSSPNRGFYLSLFNSQNFRFQVSTNGSTKDSLDTAFGTVTLNAWQHVLAIWTQTTLSLYINGLLSKTQPTSVATGTFTTTNDLLIGARLSTAGFFEGKIDEVAVWNSVQDAPTIYNSGEPTTITGALAHYKMGEGANFTNNWLVDNSALDNYSTRSFAFDGVNDYIETGTSALDGATSFTISCWVNTSYTSWQYLFGDNSLRLALKQDINRVDVSFNSGVVLQASNFAVTLGQWHHVAITFDASLPQIDRIKVYLDDFRVNNLRAGSTATSYIANNTFKIGRSGTYSLNEWNGYIDEFATFNSVQDISALYNGGTPTKIEGATAYWKMGEDANYNAAVGVSGNTTADDAAGDLLIDTGVNFTILNVEIGDLVRNTTTSSISRVNTIAATQLTLDDAIFPSGSSPDGYKITGPVVWTVPDNAGSATGTSANMTIQDMVGEAPNYTGGGTSSNMYLEDRVGDAPNSTNNALSLNIDEDDRKPDVPV